MVSLWAWCCSAEENEYIVDVGIRQCVIGEPDLLGDIMVCRGDSWNQLFYDHQFISTKNKLELVLTQFLLADCIVYQAHLLTPGRTLLIQWVVSGFWAYDQHHLQYIWPKRSSAISYSFFPATLSYWMVLHNEHESWLLRPGFNKCRRRAKFSTLKYLVDHPTPTFRGREAHRNVR